jgi:hypothetical protein
MAPKVPVSASGTVALAASVVDQVPPPPVITREPALELRQRRGVLPDEQRGEQHALVLRERRLARFLPVLAPGEAPVVSTAPS